MKSALLNSHNSINSLNSRRALTGLTDSKLVSRLEKLRGDERAVQLKILYYLNEMERRRLYLPRGYSSLFEFCTGHLKYSRSATGRRIRAARCVQKFPALAKMLLAGDLNLCVVSLLSDILTRENSKEILPKVKGRSYRDIEMLVSRYRPGRVTRDKVKPVCVMTPIEAQSQECKADLTFSPNVGSECKARLTSGRSKFPENKAVDENCPSGEELERVVIEQRFKLEFMVKSDFMKKVERMRALLSNKYPKGLEFERLFEMLMDEYLEKNAPESRIKKRAGRKSRSQNTKKAGRTNKKGCASGNVTRSQRTKDPNSKIRCTKNPDTRTRHIPRALRDKVFERDKGRCTYVGDDGRRCNSRWNLQIDHIVPYARGGKHTLDNLRLLCAKHNLYEAEREYGEDFMKKHCLRERQVCNDYIAFGNDQRGDDFITTGNDQHGDDYIYTINSVTHRITRTSCFRTRVGAGRNECQTADYITKSI